MVHRIHTAVEARTALQSGLVVWLACGGTLTGYVETGGKPAIAYYVPLSTMHGMPRWIGLTDDLVENAYVNNLLTTSAGADTIQQRSHLPHGWNPVFDRKRFDEQLANVARRYEKTAPTVEQWCDFLAAAGDTEITLSDVLLLQRLHTEEVPHCAAANLVYHHNHRLKRDTTGQIGF